LTRIEHARRLAGCHPQRKDYPLGGIPVEYRGTKVPAPDERRGTHDHSSRDRSASDRRDYRARLRVAGEDWTRLSRTTPTGPTNEQIVVNMGPQHPSTHGVLRWS